MKSIVLSIWNTSKRELERMLNNRIYFLSIVLFPLLVILFFTLLLKDGMPTRMPIAVVDLDQTQTSRKFVRNINVTPLSEVCMQLQSVDAALSELRQGNVYGIVVIPANLQVDIMASRQPKVSFYYHNGLLIAGGLMQNDLTTILHTLSTGVSIQKRQAMGQSQNEIMSKVQPIAVDTHQLFNPTASYAVYIGTIIQPIMLQLFILMITVYAIGTEIKERTSREWLRVSRKSMVIGLIGKLLPYTAAFIILMMFQNFLLYKVIQVPMNTNVFWLTTSSVLFVITYQAIGVFFVGLLPVMRHSLNLAAFYGILALTLCGFSFPVESMHPAFRYWADAFPVRHYMHIFQNQVLAGFEWKYSFQSYIALILFLFLPFLVLSRLKSAMIYQNFIEKHPGNRLKAVHALHQHSKYTNHVIQ
jgi:ABC-2 type transport system permease protein